MTSHSRDYNARSIDLGSLKKPEPLQFKMTDFRRDLQIRSKREQHARKERLRSLSEAKHLSKNAVTIDTSRGRSNIEVLRLCIKELGFREFPFGRRENLTCDIHWHACNFDENPEVYNGAVNKFPGMGDICSKMSLFRSLDTMKELFPAEYDFYPRTWYLPAQYLEFSAELRKLHEKRVKPKPTFIVKPDTGSQGDGIYLMRDPHEYNPNNGKSHVVQEYLSNVYLINNYKFDLRVYVVLKSLEPLQIYICKEGLARFSTVQYETPTKGNIHETFMHLTNYSLNKRSATFNRSEREDDGSKRTLTSVLRRIGINGHDTDKVWTNIEKCVCKTVIAILPELKVEYQATIPPNKPGPRCFQILGFDILLLDNLKPILLEVNASPSLSIDGEQEVSPGVFEYVTCALDEMVKRPLVRDALLLMSPVNKLKSGFMNKRRRRKRKKGGHSNGNGCPEPVQHQRTHILIIKADESDEEKREVDVTQQMSELNNELDFTRHEKEEEDFLDSHTEDENLNDDEKFVKILEKLAKESCLKQLYPAIYDEAFERLRILERVANLFISFLGVRGSLRIGPTGFRTFARKCRLCRRGITNAAVDIMYIDMQRRWDHMNPDRTSAMSEKKSKSTVGLCFQGFLDSCLEIARRKFPGPSKIEMLETLVDFCENSLSHHDDDGKMPNLPKLHFRRLGLAYRPAGFQVHRRSTDCMTEETVQELYSAESHSSHHPSEEIENFLRQRRKNAYQPTLMRYMTRVSLVQSPE
ncbi:tubulin polyglutamylase TTLL11-like [Ylistrum balloti]|uniref:tubulin polyglutamylase TTLL11-like n=1 Tax=Ylistrum balloti TaxID=509963 RepID=UPI002905A13D|nr:tubulin polyglutamylase TTLL11-like [Ylistrum balloti]